MHMRWTALGLLVALAGCDTSALDDVGASLSTDRGAYAEATPALVRLLNETDEPVHYSDLNCASLQVRTEAGWEDTETGTARGCRNVLYALGAGAADVGEVILDVAPGTYRFRTVVWLDGAEREGVATAPFEVDEVVPD